MLDIVLQKACNVAGEYMNMRQQLCQAIEILVSVPDAVWLVQLNTVWYVSLCLCLSLVLCLYYSGDGEELGF